MKKFDLSARGFTLMFGVGETRCGNFIGTVTLLSITECVNGQFGKKLRERDSGPK
jgi:hypothetical protein